MLARILVLGLALASCLPTPRARAGTILPGQAAGWGANAAGQASPPASATNIAGLAASLRYSLAVTDDGRVIQWGAPPATLPPNLTNALAVAAGNDFSIALKHDGTVAIWGTTNFVPTLRGRAKAVAAADDTVLILLQDGTLQAWSPRDSALAAIPAATTNILSLSAQAGHALALRADGKVIAWGNDSAVPPSLRHVVAVAAGARHSLALQNSGQIIAWGKNDFGQCSVPPGLSNVIAIAAGQSHSVALRNDGTLITWGGNQNGETNAPALKDVKLIAAAGATTLAALSSPTVMYPVDPSQDLLLLYNAASRDSRAILNYYRAHRPGIHEASVLGVDWPGVFIRDRPGTGNFMGLAFAPDYESITLEKFNARIFNPVRDWLAAHPTLRPRYVVLMPDLPARISNRATNASAYPFYGPAGSSPTVSAQLAASIPGWRPLITSLNMFTPEDCVAYIDKVAAMAARAPDPLLISARAAGYGNRNWFFDDSHKQYFGSTPGLTASNGVVRAGADPATVIYKNIFPDIGFPCHIAGGADVAGYLCWGVHSSLGAKYPGDVRWTGHSGWYLIETIESYNGMRYEYGHGNFRQWFARDAFGGADWSNTPVGAVSSPDEPFNIGACNPQVYFGLWAAGKNFAICAWAAKQTSGFQATGDPFVCQ